LVIGGLLRLLVAAGFAADASANQAASGRKLLRAVGL